MKMFKKKRSGGRKLLGKTHTDRQRQVGGDRRPAVAPAPTCAVVKQREEGTAGTIFVCLRDKSKIVAVD